MPPRSDLSVKHSKRRGIPGSASGRKAKVFSPDCIINSDRRYVVIEGKVYDVTAFIDQHPGGRVILSATNQEDSTDIFRVFHKEESWSLLSNYYVGVVEGNQKQLHNVEFERRFRELREEFQKEGLLEASIPYYVWKFFSTTMLLVLSCYLTIAFDALSVKLLGAMVMALFWQQCGWLSHDLAHHQVFKNRKWNDMLAVFIGNFYLGFSLSWWKNKHNTHHAIPNLLESELDRHDGDPDIDTLPFLAWSVEMIRKTTIPGNAANTPMAKFFTRFQNVLYFPILFFARITWAIQSITFAFRMDAGDWASSEGKLTNNRYKIQQEPVEKAFIILHYIGLLYLTFAFNHTILQGILYYFVAQTFCGLLLAIAFGVGHNGREVVPHNKVGVTGKPYGFAELQVRTTRNVDDSWFGIIGWFMGGLHYQVEHHLLPTCPRHNLRYAAPRVKALCEEYGIDYHSTSLWQGTVEILQHLGDVARDVAYNKLD